MFAVYNFVPAPTPRRARLGAGRTLTQFALEDGRQPLKPAAEAQLPANLSCTLASRCCKTKHSRPVRLDGVHESLVVLDTHLDGLRQESSSVMRGESQEGPLCERSFSSSVMSFGWSRLYLQVQTFLSVDGKELQGASVCRLRLR